MKKTILYGILFAVPGIFISLLVSYLITGFILGALWLFVFGDGPWPDWLSIILPLVTFCIFILIITVVTIWGYQTGKKIEEQGSFNQKHLWYSVIATVIPILVMVWHQNRTTGEQIPSVICSDYCISKGYSASSMPPEISGLRSCSCLNGQGVPEHTIELGDIADF